MNEEELFCKLYPEYSVNGKPLSPYFDLFESGYEQSEKQIEELEKENAELKLKVTALENANRAMVKELDDTTSGGLSVLENVVRSKEQLTKAKEIIKEILEEDNYSLGLPKELRLKTEQFLKEVEK